MKYHIYILRSINNGKVIDCIECIKYTIKDGMIYFTDAKGEGCIPIHNVKAIIAI